MTEMTELNTNPGGKLAPNEIVGRDALVARLWRVLERRSVYITAERRMGKTSVVRDKMGKELPSGVRVVYMDVSTAVTPLEFIEELINKSYELLDSGKKAKFVLAFVKKSLASFEFSAGGSVKFPPQLGTEWKNLLENLLRDLSSHSDRIVLAFDELPLMLLAIKRKIGGEAGEAVVMELLDTLRAARQTYPSLRMIYTGSLGLHHVLTILKEQGYQNDPTNDMTTVEVEPLSVEDATQLADRLLRGEKLPHDKESAHHLAKVTDGMAFYIHHIVEAITLEGENADTATIDRFLAARLTDTRDPWHLRYYDERIDTHYQDSLRPLARAILDQLVVTEKPLSFDDLVDGIDPTKVTLRDPETVRTVLRLLGLDNYLTRDENGGYGFRYPFIKRTWQAIRQ